MPFGPGCVTVFDFVGEFGHSRLELARTTSQNGKERKMTIKVGDRLPEGEVEEHNELEQPGCPVGPIKHNVAELAKGKKLIIIGLPGAFTPTCSAKHVPGYVQHFDDLHAKGIDEVWCISVNDVWVMGAWGRDQHAFGKVRMLADGQADYTKKLGLELDMTGRGWGTRARRYAMLVDDGVVKKLNIEAPGKFEVSGAEAMLAQL